MPTEEVKPAGETPAEPTEQPKGETPAAADEFDKDRAMATIEKLRGFEKEAKAAQKRLAEFEAAEKQRKEAEMSELEKAQKRAEELEGQLKAERLAGMKRDAAAKHNLPAELAARLQGETPEALEADAKTLAELLPKKPPAGQPVNPGDNASQKGETPEEKRRRLLG